MNKIIFLLLFLVVIVLVYFRLKNSEHFRITDIPFIDRKQAASVIDKIDTFHLYTRLDLKLRGIKDRRSIKKHYKDYLEDWTDYEYKLMMWMLTTMILKTPPEYQFIYGFINFAKFADHIENGFPHTNGSTIFLTSGFVKEIIPLLFMNVFMYGRE